MIKVSDYIVKRILETGTDVFFGYQGGNISHLIDSIGNHPEARFVETCHEQAAAFAANAYAQMNGTIGVALASSGPGAINMINGIANAFCDSIPCIFFTGDVNTTAKKTDGSKRQNAFQEIDIIPMVRSITKYAVSINSAEEITEELEKAIDIAGSDRPGPVLINLPHDMQRSFIEIEKTSGVSTKTIAFQSANYAEEALSIILTSTRPVFLIGGGLRAKVARAAFKHVLEKISIPVVCSLLGLDILSHENLCYRGVIGDYGSEGANRILKESDCIVVLGSRLDDRQVSHIIANEFAQSNKTIIHIDVDSNELGNKAKETLSIECGVDDFLTAFHKLLPSNIDYSSWLKKTLEITEEKNQFKKQRFHPNRLIRDLSLNCEAVYTFDVGNNQMHSMQSVFVKGDTRVLTSGGLGSMGYSMPAAIGACFAKNVDKVVAICGDGGIQMNIQELQTISYYDLPVNILLLNNSGLGMIYDLQDRLFQGRHYGTTECYGVPNFEAIAKAYGFNYLKVLAPEDIYTAVSRMKNETRIFVELKYEIGTPVSMIES